MTKDHQELLKSAARVAGIRGELFNGMGILREGMDVISGGIWNSLTKDSDAMQLARILIRDFGFELKEHNDAVCFESDAFGSVEVPWINQEGDPIRLAITIAAAHVASTFTPTHPQGDQT